jgi:hypothetical protein
LEGRYWWRDRPSCTASQWHTIGKEKQPCYFTRRTAVIIGEPNAFVAEVHDRMPAILSRRTSSLLIAARPEQLSGESVSMPSLRYERQGIIFSHRYLSARQPRSRRLGMTKSPTTSGSAYPEVLPQGYDAQRAKLVSSGQPIGVAPAPVVPNVNDAVPAQDVEEITS